MSIFDKIKKFVSHKVDEKDVKPGDHLYVWSRKNFYTHHGIAIDNNMVVNVTNARVFSYGKANRPMKREGCTVEGCLYGRRGDTTVYRICLDCFKNDKPVHRYRYGVGAIEHMFKLFGTCTMARSLPDEVVTENADLIIRNKFGQYRLTENNCEDFALYCKTNLRVAEDNSDRFQGTSSQANGIRAALLAVVAGAGATALTYKYNVHGNRLFRLSATPIAVSALIFVTYRHFYDIGVRSDAVVESTRDRLTRLTADERNLPDSKLERVEKTLEEIKKGLATGRYKQVEKNPDGSDKEYDPLRYLMIYLKELGLGDAKTKGGVPQTEGGVIADVGKNTNK